MHTLSAVSQQNRSTTPEKDAESLPMQQGILTRVSIVKAEKLPLRLFFLYSLFLWTGLYWKDYCTITDLSDVFISSDSDQISCLVIFVVKAIYYISRKSHHESSALAPANSWFVLFDRYVCFRISRIHTGDHANLSKLLPTSPLI